MSTGKRIKADAEKCDNILKSTDYRIGFKYGYIAGATAEHAHMLPVIDAAEKVAKLFSHSGDHQTCAICQLAKALEQWKGTGKEETKPEPEGCPYCGSATCTSDHK